MNNRRKFHVTNCNVNYDKGNKEKIVEQLLKKKEDDYGHFPNNCYVVAKFIQGVLEVVNKQHLTVPITLIPQLMIVLKLTRTINDGTKKNLYKNDTHSDIYGYNSLLKEMMRIADQEDKNEK